MIETDFTLKGARLARALKVRKALGENLEHKRETGWMWAPAA